MSIGTGGDFRAVNQRVVVGVGVVGIGGGVAEGRVERTGDFLIVIQTVAVGIGQGRIRSKDLFGGVRQKISIRIIRSRLGDQIGELRDFPNIIQTIGIRVVLALDLAGGLVKTGPDDRRNSRCRMTKSRW